MARKKTGFQWTAEDSVAEVPTESEPLSRTAEKAVNRTLKRLAKRLATLSPGQLAELPLEPELCDEITQLAQTGTTSTRRRQLLRVRGLLHAVDLDELETALAGR